MEHTKPVEKSSKNIFDDVLKRMLSTPPDPHKPPKPTKPKAKKKKPA